MRYRRIIALLSAILMLMGNFSSVWTPAAQAQAPSSERFFTIMHTNDEHSALLPSPLIDYDPKGVNPSQGGFARLAQAVDNVRQELRDEPTLLVSGGDFLSGSPFAWLALDGRAAELTLMQQLGYDVVTIGNHEYDYGPEVLAKYLQAAGYPAASAKTAIVASNIDTPAGHPLGTLDIQKTYIKTLDNGLKIGFFGLIGKDATEVAPYAPPVLFTDQQAAAKAAVAELQAAKVDVIVAISHSGEDEDQPLAKAVPGIDVIVGGHSHTALQQPIIVNDAVIVQAGASLENLGVLELAYNQDTGKVRVRNQENNQPFLVPLTESTSFSPVFASKVNAYSSDLDNLLVRLTNGRFTKMAQPIIHSAFPVINTPELAETPFGDYVTDAMRMIGEQVTGDKVDFAFEADGVIRGGIRPGSLPSTSGQVALFDLADLVGLGLGPDQRPGYPMVSIYFTGEEIRRVLEVGTLLSELKGDTYFLQASGLQVKYDPARAILATIPIKGTPIPTGRAVISAERFTGDGIQTNDPANYTPLQRGDQKLYHIISDYYLAAFLPMVGEVLPSLGLVMKDKDGNPVKSVDDCIIYRDGQEMKVWQAVLEYTASQSLGASGLPEMPGQYQNTSGRLVQVKTLPIWLWPAIIIVLALALIIWGIRRFRKSRRELHA